MNKIYKLNFKKVAIICLAIFTASFMYHFIAPSPAQKGGGGGVVDQIKEVPKNAANTVRETFGMEVPQAELTYCQQFKAMMTWRNVIKLVVAIVGIVALYYICTWGYNWYKANAINIKQQLNLINKDRK